MSTLLSHIMAESFQEAKTIIVERLDVLRDAACVHIKEMIGDSFSSTEELAENNIMHRGRMTVIRRRIRKGKLQRNVRRSSVKGYMIKKGKVTRIPAAQRLKMRMKARRAQIKRRAKMQQILRKRKLSLRKRTALGIR